MSEPFIGEIMMVGFNFAPRGWAFTDGQILPINQNQSLYSLIGTNYGGDGRTSFALPDLRGRTPIHRSEDARFRIGNRGGAETVTLTTAEMAAHTHQVKGTSELADANNTGANANRAFATVAESEPNDIIYGNAANLVSMADGIVSNTGGSQPHNNIQPMLALSFVIALQGLFPSRN